MMSFEAGYVVLFVSSFTAATLLPGGSEIVVLAMVRSGFSPWLVLLVATSGNYLGALTNYGLGRWVKVGFAKRLTYNGRFVRIARQWYQRWGAVSLTLSWVPFIGDPLTLLAGVGGIGLVRFSFWVILGKAARYTAIVFVARA